MVLLCAVRVAEGQDVGGWVDELGIPFWRETKSKRRRLQCAIFFILQFIATNCNHNMAHVDVNVSNAENREWDKDTSELPSW